jgi:AraC-like DNA-binding protein
MRRRGGGGLLRRPHEGTDDDELREHLPVAGSRSVLAERFRHYLRRPPISYLTEWRLQLGARALKSSDRSVAEIASEVGYETEASFNRAFKRQFHLPPARYRKSLESL